MAPNKRHGDKLKSNHKPSNRFIASLISLLSMRRVFGLPTRSSGSSSHAYTPLRRRPSDVRQSHDDELSKQHAPTSAHGNNVEPKSPIHEQYPHPYSVLFASRKRSVLIIMLLLLSLAFLACVARFSSAVDLVVDVEYSKCKGFTQDGINKWLGIRYAAPPLGELRFRAPQPPLVNDTLQDAQQVCMHSSHV